MNSAVRIRDRTRPALLIDSGSRTDVGVVRSLGFAGIPVHLLAPDVRSVTTRSRYVTAVHAFPDFDSSEDARVQRIREVASSLDARPVLLVTGDRALRFASRRREDLEGVLDHCLGAPELVEACLDKRQFARTAAALGLPIPRTIVPAGIEEVRAVAGTLDYPVYVKPSHREAWSGRPPGSVHNLRGWAVGSAAELLRTCERLGPGAASNLLIQDLVTGPDREELSIHAFCSSPGILAGAFTGVKLRIWPPHGGLGVHVLSRRVPEAVRLAEAALAALRYTGFAILNCKRDGRTGELRILEINGRHSTWTELPSRAGCNFPALAYAAVTHQPLPAMAQREGVSWLDVWRDSRALRTYLRSREWSAGGYLKSLRTVRCFAFFAWDDLKPFLHQLRHRKAG